MQPRRLVGIGPGVVAWLAFAGGYADAEPPLLVDLAGVMGTGAVVEHLRPLLDFHDPRYYPSDALIRHAAMASLVRQALATKKAPSLAAPPAASVTPDAENRP